MMMSDIAYDNTRSAYMRNNVYCDSAILTAIVLDLEQLHYLATVWIYVRMPTPLFLWSRHISRNVSPSHAYVIDG